MYKEIMGMLGALALAACGGDPPMDPAPAPAPGPAPGPLYAVTTQVLGMNSTSYVALVPSLEATQAVDLKQALEVPGRAVAVGPRGGGAIFVAGNEGPTLTRYDVSAAGGFQRGATLSFAPQGVTSLFAYAEQFVFLSEDKAYYIDDDMLQLIVWNPRTMAFVKAVPLDGLARTGWTVTVGLTPTLRGGELVFAASYYQLQNERYDREARVAFIDVASDAVKKIVSDSRCSYYGQALLAPSGDLYFGSEVYTAAVAKVLGPNFGGPSCAIRVPAGAQAVDDSFLVDFNARAGGAPAGAMLAAGGTRAFIRVLDESLLPMGQMLTPRRLFGSPFWRWASLDLAGSEPAARRQDLPPGPASVLLYQVDGKALTNESTADYAKTTLLDLAAEGGPRRGLTITGVPFSIVRVR